MEIGKSAPASLSSGVVQISEMCRLYTISMSVRLWKHRKGQFGNVSLVRVKITGKQ
jgi:hypothetical protein